MADGFGCKKCGYQEAAHEVVDVRREPPLGKPRTKEEKKEIEANIKLEFPGICRRYVMTSEEKAFRKEEFID